MAEYAYLVVYLPRGTSRDARDAARKILTDHAEYGDWNCPGSRSTPTAAGRLPSEGESSPSPHILSYYPLGELLAEGLQMRRALDLLYVLVRGFPSEGDKGEAAHGVALPPRAAGGFT